MSEVLIWIVCITAVLAILILGILFAYRVSRPHSRKKYYGQSQLNRKTGTSPTTPTQPKIPGGGKEKEGYSKYAGSILIAIIGAGLAIWGFITQVQPAVVGNWSWQYAFPLLVVWGTLAAIIALNKKELGDSGKTLQAILAVGMGAALFVLPIWSHFATSSSQELELAQQQQLATVPTLSMPANGNSLPLQARPGHPVTFYGDGFATHCVYADGRDGVVGDLTNPCSDGTILYFYVRDLTGKPNKVTYEVLNRK